MLSPGAVQNRICHVYSADYVISSTINDVLYIIRSAPLIGDQATGIPGRGSGGERHCSSTERSRRAGDERSRGGFYISLREAGRRHSYSSAAIVLGNRSPP